MPQWSRLRLVTPRENADACAQLLLDAGCEGVQVEDLAVHLDESEDATLVPTEQATIIGYVSSDEAAERAGEAMFEAIQRGGIEATLSAEPIEDEAWATSWMQNFPALQIGPFRIAPPWDEENPDGTIPIRIDPGLAFGTGQHPTTRMCLELLAECWPQISETSSPRVLDVGCGSGILSIAAARLGGEVVGSDPDAFCTQATLDNARDNGVSIEVVQQAGASWTGEQFDLVLANLMSTLLIGLADELFNAAKSDGWLIVSGISAPRADEVEAALHGAGFKTVEKRELDGDHRGDFIERWTAFVMQK